jgi:hypothetical protein
MVTVSLANPDPHCHSVSESHIRVHAPKNTAHGILSTICASHDIPTRPQYAVVPMRIKDKANHWQAGMSSQLDTPATSGPPGNHFSAFGLRLSSPLRFETSTQRSRNVMQVMKLMKGYRTLMALNGHLDHRRFDANRHHSHHSELRMCYTFPTDM